MSSTLARAAACSIRVVMADDRTDVRRTRHRCQYPNPAAGCGGEHPLTLVLRLWDRHVANPRDVGPRGEVGREQGERRIRAGRAYPPPHLVAAGDAARCRGAAAQGTRESVPRREGGRALFGVVPVMEEELGHSTILAAGGLRAIRESP